MIWELFDVAGNAACKCSEDTNSISGSDLKTLEAFDFAQYEPHIVPHRTDPFLLYCACAAPPLPPRRPSAAERRCPAGGRR